MFGGGLDGAAAGGGLFDSDEAGEELATLAD